MVVSSTQAMASPLYARGKAAWPKLDVPADVFDAAVARHASVTDAEELYLACACATGSSDAIRAFEARYFTCIAAVVRRIGLPDDDANEVAQVLRQRLFVGEHAGVVEYAGRGQLGGLVQVAATRIALNLR